MKMKMKILLAILTTAFSISSMAAISNNTMKSTVKISPYCQISVDPLNFGVINPTSSGPIIVSNTPLKMLCSAGLMATIIFSTGISNDYLNRYMVGTNGNTDKLYYNLHYGNAPEILANTWVRGGRLTYLTLWASGNPEQYILNGKISNNQFVKPDTYSDTITVTFLY